MCPPFSNVTEFCATSLSAEWHSLFNLFSGSCEIICKNSYAIQKNSRMGDQGGFDEMLVQELANRGELLLDS